MPSTRRLGQSPVVLPKAGDPLPTKSQPAAPKSGESFKDAAFGANKRAQLDPPDLKNGALSLQAGRVLREKINDARVQRQNGPYVPENEFISRLAQTPEQAKVLGALTQNKEYKALWSWFSKFPGGNPIRFAVQPGLKMDGIERFGGFFGRELLLLVNPAKKEHVENPQELVNTIVHELVHAALDVQDAAKRKGLTITPPPLPEGATDLYRDEHFAEHFGDASPEKADWKKGSKAWEYLQKNYGDSDSTPETEFIDVNRETQALVKRVVAENLAKTGIGHPTITGMDLA